MNSTELNTLLTELTSVLRKRFSLNVENAVAIVMQSTLANDLQSGKCKERDINILVDMLSRVN